ncbi:MAG: hypothetical protein RIS70_127 [Planctomycetota bacterium]|jgi:hypothetical protein
MWGARVDVRLGLYPKLDLHNFPLRISIVIALPSCYGMSELGKAIAFSAAIAQLRRILIWPSLTANPLGIGSTDIDLDIPGRLK